MSNKNSQKGEAMTPARAPGIQSAPAKSPGSSTTKTGVADRTQSAAAKNDSRLSGKK